MVRGAAPVVAGVGTAGAGVPSTPRTRPAGVRRAATGVVSGVGGGDSAARARVACSECFAFEQPGPNPQTAATSSSHANLFAFSERAAQRRRTDFVASRVAPLTDFDASRAGPDCNSLNCNEENARLFMVRRLILPVPKKSAGMGVPAWGGAEELPPLLFGRHVQRALRRTRAGSEAASSSTKRESDPRFRRSPAILSRSDSP